MPDLTFPALVQRQLQMTQHLSETLMARALAGSRAELDNFFAAQDRLEHWLQYLSPLPGEAQVLSGLDAPPPLPQMRPAPALPHEQDALAQTLDGLRPSVTFAPVPIQFEDLERGPGEPEG